MRYRDGIDLQRATPVPPPRTGLRLGLLTFHRCINYGSFWQARCMVDGLTALGHEVTVLDHYSPAAAQAELACALQPHRPVPSDRDDRRRHAEKVGRFARAQARLPLSPRFGLDRGPEQRFDAVIVGSDEVWNAEHPWYGGAGLFWGQGLQRQPLIAHAVSTGSHVGPLGPDRVTALGRYEAIAVRDVTTRAMVHAATGRHPPLALDPCLQFPVTAPPLQRAPYALVYGHDFPGWSGHAVRDWAVRQGLQLLSIGYRNAFADAQWLEAGPADFACAVAGASAIVTTMFHGAVFALNAGAPFAAIPSAYRATKLSDFMSLVGAERHLASHADALAKALAAGPGRRVAGTIAALRASSHATLRQSLAAAIA